jgi:hypothetical protein
VHGDGGLTRRGLLVASGALAVAALRPPAGAALGARGVRAAPAGRPDRQHAWDATLAVDEHGNRTAPRLHRLLLLDLAGPPGIADATALEDALRAVEAQQPAGPSGILLTVGWGPAWFAALGVPSPVPEPAALAGDRAPRLERFAACIHLASDFADVLARAERTVRTALGGALVLAGRRTGFTGRGLPRRLGPPAARRLAREAPLYLGFASTARRSQAREGDVTLRDGPWAGGTTMHVSVLELALERWGRLDERERVAAMFAPGVTPARARRPGPGLVLPAPDGRAGHAQAAAAARRDGRPRLLRRDFDGVQDGRAVVHFVSLQRDLEDLAATRRALVAHGPGIEPFVRARSRAAFVVPPRSRRTCPLLPGWDA